MNNTFYNKFLTSRVFNLVFEGEDTGAAGTPDPTPAPAAPAAAANSQAGGLASDVGGVLSSSNSVDEHGFTEGQRSLIDEMVSSSTTKLRTEYDNAMKDLKAVQAKSAMADKDKENTSELLKNVQSEVDLVKMQHDTHVNQLNTDHSAAVDGLSTEKDLWRQRFEKSVLTREISDAAMKYGAVSSLQIERMVTNNVQFQESETGSVEPIVNYNFYDEKTGDMKTTQISVDKAVASMQQAPEYSNLFKPQGSSGTGRHNRSDVNAGDIDPAEIAKDPVAYRKWRAAQGR